MGRETAVVDRMDLHLLWANEGRLFVKPVPRFLLDLVFCQRNLQCPESCMCGDRLRDAYREIPRKVALGFLYTYACLISSESDFHVANEKRLLPRREDDSPIEWADWKTLARALLRTHERDPPAVHPRFLRAELRLSRINTIHRFTQPPPFEPYLRDRHNYSSLFRDNLAWMAAATVFVALVLTAMQVGLATERLRGDAAFQQASYGFTVFAILGPMCAFGLVVLGALFNLLKDLPSLLGGQRNRMAPHPQHF
ncbi:Subtilisin-like serine protease [Madurella fahalii]|uniref:Subtilisin-like serine protease n=1 Tax=Madurella fahalii TaxID=1157608 RepID=A0ABQ0GIG0_9PEZI